MLEQPQLQQIAVPSKVPDSLLEEQEPSVEYHTLLELSELDEDEGKVAEARERIGKTGWAAGYSRQKEGKYWDNPVSGHVPKFSATAWQLVVLADLGVNSEGCGKSSAREKIG